jgi:hypothetical protein
MPAWKGIVGKGFTAADFEQYAQTIQLTVWRPQFVVLHVAEGDGFEPSVRFCHAKPRHVRKLQIAKPYQRISH